jgi:hypothetical protein
VDVHATIGFVRPQPRPGGCHEVCAGMTTVASFCFSFFAKCYLPSLLLTHMLSPSVALFRSDVNEINLMALDEKNELPVFWAYIDTADPTSFIVKVPMHCYYGDRGSLTKPRMSYHPHMARNAPSMLRKMDSMGVTGFEYHVRFRPEPGQPAKPPVIRLMRPGLDPKTGNVMSTGAHCTPLLQPATWNAGLGSGKAYSVNLVLPWLIDNLTDPQAGHGPAVVAAPTLAVYNEEQVSEKHCRISIHSLCVTNCDSRRR